jgi:hypothetical protein
MTRPRQNIEHRPASVDDLDPVALGVAISLLPPNHPLVVAAKSAAEVSEERHARAVAMRDASKDVAGAHDWKGYAAGWVPREEIVRRRSEPGVMVPQQRDPTREACRRAHQATENAVGADKEAERAAQVNRRAAVDATAGDSDARERV